MIMTFARTLKGEKMPAYDRACKGQKGDCFALTKFGCGALTNTYFRSGKCPFYKPASQRQAELEELERRAQENAEHINRLK